MPDMDTYRQVALIILTVYQLKEMCKVRNLPVKGKKNELIERLLEFQSPRKSIFDACSPEPRPHLAESKKIDPKKLAKAADLCVANRATHKDSGATQKKHEWKQQKKDGKENSNTSNPKEGPKQKKGLRSRSVTPTPSAYVENVDEKDNDSESISNVIEEQEELDESQDPRPHLAESKKIDPKKLAKAADLCVANRATHKDSGATQKKHEWKQQKKDGKENSNTSNPKEGPKQKKGLRSRSVTPTPSAYVENVDEKDNDSESISNVIEEQEELDESQDLRQHLAESKEIDPKKLAKAADLCVAKRANHKDSSAPQKKDEWKQQKKDGKKNFNTSNPKEGPKQKKGYPEAIPMRTVTAQAVAKALLGAEVRRGNDGDSADPKDTVKTGAPDSWQAWKKTVCKLQARSKTVTFNTLHDVMKKAHSS
ncbi:uncharacterized protein [Ambystoma mexicanum]|uniref:uncharacterized protein n=1 Tax=Ambystoma mexicanum TaxID=8296 RepID=UPI0037E8C8A7